MNKDFRLYLSVFLFLVVLVLLWLGSIWLKENTVPEGWEKIQAEQVY